MCLKITKTLIALCGFLSSIDSALCEGTDFVALAQKWAPKIYLNSREEFWPGDVEVFLKQVFPTGKDCPSASGIPTGPQSQKCFLTTKGKPYDLLNDENSFLYGVKPQKGRLPPVPAYAHVQNCGGDHVVLAYWIFFPFNEGKDMCDLVKKMPFLKGLVECGENKTVVGNHVGDWEHLSVELKDGQPESLFLSVHDGGVYYSYDKCNNTFELASQLKTGVLKVPHPPSTINMEDTHPILYSALGSHAVWSAVGNFSYSRVQISELVDETDQGPEWDTWKDLKVFYSNETTPSWWYYDGRWGNRGSQCILGIYCIFSDGPKGLSTRPEDYKCLC